MPCTRSSSRLRRASGPRAPSTRRAEAYLLTPTPDAPSHELLRQARWRVLRAGRVHGVVHDQDWLLQHVSRQARSVPAACMGCLNWSVSNPMDWTGDPVAPVPSPPHLPPLLTTAVRLGGGVAVDAWNLRRTQADWAGWVVGPRGEGGEGTAPGLPSMHMKTCNAPHAQRHSCRAAGTHRPFLSTPKPPRHT
eukprot:349763-Chlamydomonas_euryale.AAC.3